jgi:formate hydrogenlyase subunit 3/multisubunit Na+/H+ antiporter MnhD subunit
MSLLLVGLAIVILGGGAALAANRRADAASFLGAGGALIGCGIAFAGALQALLAGGAESLRLPWAVPLGGFHLQLDALSALFLLPVLGLSGIAAVYGAEYLRGSLRPRALGFSWFCYNLLIASMALVLVAADGVLFLVAWEVMALASFFLVAFEHERAEVREAAWTYLIASHLGTAFVVAFFLILGTRAGSLDFDRLGGVSGARASLLFLFAVIGFGTKAGFMPLHVWLPEAHPAAPSHVSAVMSGVMIKTGIYGILRAVTLLDAPAAAEAMAGKPPEWWGWLLVGIGLTSGVLGVLFALAQHDLKRLLAYHSVENIGIIALGLGIGLIGVSAEMPALAVIGFAGALLHVVNHAVFKGLLFLGAGAVQHATGTREIDHLGGLLKRMPWTGAAFLVGAAAISGLPPLNGFVSEFLIYVGAFHGGAALSGANAVASLFAILALALIGGLALACFAKAFGIIFLGEPRSEHALHAHEAGLAMRLPMLLLAAVCLAIGLCAPQVVLAMAPAVACIVRMPPADTAHLLSATALPLSGIVLCAAGFLFLAALLGWIRLRLAGRDAPARTGTWDCGYARPTARMQYTASSFAQPLTDLFRVFLGTRREFTPPQGALPTQPSAFHSETPDVFTERCFRPVFDGIAWLMAHPRRLQHGRVQVYVLYVALTLVALLIWYLGWLT